MQQGVKLRRVRRRLFTLFAVLSLVLAIVGSVLWVRSYRTADIFGTQEGAWVWRHWVYSSRGALFAGHALRPPTAPARFSWQRLPGGAPVTINAQLIPRYPGLQLGWYADAAMSGICLPYWLVVSVAGAAPLMWVLRRVRRQSAPGLCPACGYDLRATPDRCPECGYLVTTGK
jgi:hypothetical protein